MVVMKMKCAFPHTILQQTDKFIEELEYEDLSNALQVQQVTLFLVAKVNL
jgi:hypothetical protein